MSTTLIGYYADILSFGATWSLTSGSADSAFPLTNLNNPYADVISKLTGTSGTYRGAIASTAIQGIVIVNCNLGGLTLTVTNNGAMASQNLIIPATAADSLSLNGFVDLRAVTTAGTQWNVAISGAAANVAIGKILLLANLRQITIRSRPRFSETKPFIMKRNSRGVARGYPQGTRYRGLDVSLMKESQRATWTTLRRGSVGPTQPFVLIPENSVNDPIYAWFPSPTWQHERTQTNDTQWDDTLEEMNPGAAL